MSVLDVFFNSTWAFEVCVAIFATLMFCFKHFYNNLELPWIKWLAISAISIIGLIFSWKLGAIYNQQTLIFLVIQILILASLGQKNQILATFGSYLFLHLFVVVDAYIQIFDSLPVFWQLFHSEERSGNAVLITYLFEAMFAATYIYWKSLISEDQDEISDQAYIYAPTTVDTSEKPEQPTEKNNEQTQEAPKPEQFKSTPKLEPLQVEKILESLVHFMHHNFDAQTAVGFLSMDGGQTFEINGFKTKDEFRPTFNEHIKLNGAGIGVVSKAISSKSGFTSGNLTKYDKVVDYFQGKYIANSIIVTPILEENTKGCVGFIVVDHPNINKFSDEDTNAMNKFAAIASKLLSQVKQKNELQKNATKNILVYEIASVLNQQLHVAEVLKVVLGNFKKVFDCDRLLFCDYNPNIAKARVMKVIGAEAGIKEEHIFEIDDPKSFYGSIFRNSKEMIWNKFNESTHRFANSSEDIGFVGSAIAAPIFDENNSCVGVVGIESRFQNAFEENDLVVLKTLTLAAAAALAKAKVYTKMEKQATTDGLTGIPNHRTFQDYLDKEISKSERKQRKVSLLILDIDHFKHFNDTYGHPVGDKVLKIVATTIRKLIRTTDLVARYGGEEFVVVLDEANIEDARMSAERIRAGIEAIEVPHEDKILKVCVSVGCAIFPLDGSIKAELIENADKALYHSKENGRNRVTMYCEMPRQ